MSTTNTNNIDKKTKTTKVYEYFEKNFINVDLNDKHINYNTFDITSTKIDINKVKKIIYNLLVWLNNNINNPENDFDNDPDKLRKKFEGILNKEFRASKIVNIRKSIVLNICEHIDYDDMSQDIYFDVNITKQLDMLKYLLRKRPMRNVSGITSITMITTPFPDGQSFSCKHNCYYCPNEPAHEGNNWQAQPRSYLYNEPAVLRANQNGFYSVDQMLSRLDTYFFNGHVVDKIEIILEGGTYTEYPEDYLERFNRDIFYSANIYFEYRDIIDRNIPDSEKIILLKMIREPLSIRDEIVINKTARVHIIGICAETRPDAIDDKWLWRFREWGITRIQLGMQHVDNMILKKINRGHTIETGLWAMQYLKDNCFKIDIHIMPDLPGSSPEKDKEMFDYVYKYVSPDQMKIYPCEVVPWTVIEKWYNQGKYTPYFENNYRDLFEVIKYGMVTCPLYIRLPRIIRDIPNSYVESGNTVSNMRQILDKEIESSGLVSYDIRSREIGRHPKYYKKEAKYNIHYNRANNGDDYFIAYESLDTKVLFGFIRLRINDKKNMCIFDVLKDKALIRELHVYGDTNAVGIYSNYGSQHTGIGRNLLKLAEKKSMMLGYYGIVVISGEGVKGYYEKFGYKEVDTFMVKDFPFWKVWFYIFINFWIVYFQYFNKYF